MPRAYWLISFLAKAFSPPGPSIVPKGRGCFIEPLSSSSRDKSMFGVAQVGLDGGGGGGGDHAGGGGLGGGIGCEDGGGGGGGEGDGGGGEDDGDGAEASTKVSSKLGPPVCRRYYCA